jgi:hypothetical protein
MWLFIDVLRIYTLLATTVVVVFLHIVKFISYKAVKLIHRQFVKYTTIQVTLGLLNIIGVWFLIEVLHQPTVLSSMAVVSFLYVLRFAAFKATKLTME